MDNENVVCIAIAETYLNSSSIQANLIFINSNLRFIPDTITSL